eukprot:gene8848-9796_t
MADPPTILMSFYVLLIFCIGLLGNLTTITVTCVYRELQITTHYYILNLAIADLFVSTVTVPMKLWLFYNPHNAQLCKASIFFLMLFFTASVLAILLIAIDRYVFICKPLYYRTHAVSTKTLVWILISWLLALTMAVIPFTSILPATSQHTGPSICTYSLVMPDSYLIFFAVTTQLMPPVIFVFMYTKIMLVARRHAIDIAMQFNSTNSKRRDLDDDMDWLRRRKFTDALVAPFHRTSQSLDSEAKIQGNEELPRIRKILYKNYNTWRQIHSELKLKRQSQYCDHQQQQQQQNLPSLLSTSSSNDHITGNYNDYNDNDDVFESFENNATLGQLSNIGVGLRGWRARASKSQSSSSSATMFPSSTVTSHVQKSTQVHERKLHEETTRCTEQARSSSGTNCILVENNNETDSVAQLSNVTSTSTILSNLSEETSNHSDLGKNNYDRRSNDNGNKINSECNDNCRNDKSKTDNDNSKNSCTSSIDNAGEDNDNSSGDDKSRNRNAMTRPRLIRYFSSKRTSLTRIALESISKLTLSTRKKAENENRKRFFKEFKAIKMLGLVVGGFILLNMPMAITDMVNVSARKQLVPMWLVNTALCLAGSNPAINPIIYVIVRKQFRDAYVKLWSCGRYGRKVGACS